MSWRGYEAGDDPMRRFGRPGGDWQGLRPSFDNPMTWAFRVGRILRITIRVHVIFVIFVVAELLRALFLQRGDSGPLTLWPMAAAMGLLFCIVLLHELGHCLACRRTGGTADEILMWPLGGLAYCNPPNRWQAHLITVIGGPAVNVVIGVVLAVVLAALTGRIWGTAIPNPFTFGALAEVAHSWLLLMLYLFASLNLIILLFNLLPIFPLDGGRVVQALLWARIGYARSMRLTVRVGYVGAIGLAVAGLATRNWMLIGIAIFGGITCWITHKQLEFTESELGLESPWAESLREPEESRPARPTRADRRADRRRQRERAEALAVDDILQKIATSGMESLSATEKRKLRRATRRRREGQ